MIKNLTDFVKRDELFPEIASRYSGKNDKTGICYHVITQSWARETIFYSDVAQYRHNLLCQMCSDRKIIIVFAATNPNHTHEVFLVPDWETLATTMRLLNTNVSKFIRRQYPNKVRNGKKLFREDVGYYCVKDMEYLFYLGKYIHDNPLYLKEAGKPVPFTCFWMFENGYLKEPYREDIYTGLFGMSYKDVYRIYSTMTKKEVKQYAQERFKDWTKEMNERFFSKPKGNS